MSIEQLTQFLDAHIETAAATAQQLTLINKIHITLGNTLTNGGKILIAGNRGSAGDAQHFAAELIGRFKLERRALPAIARTTDTSAITAIGNDYAYDDIFTRQLEGLCSPDDFIAISTSGNSLNILKVLEKAKAMGARTVGFTGKDGGQMHANSRLCDHLFIAPSHDTPRIQELHIFAVHSLCALVEQTVCN